MANKIKIKVEGFDEVKKNFQDFAQSGNISVPNYLNLISESAIKLLKDNTPVDTGALRDSWQEVARTQNSVEVGVSDDQEEKLGYVINGTIFIPANDFMDRVSTVVNQLMQSFMSKSLKQAHKFWKEIPDVHGTGNITSTVGLTGTKFNNRRSFGRSTLYKPRTGRKRLNRRIGRRRRVGSSIIKTVQVG